MTGCGEPPNPLDKLSRALDRHPQYSVVLADMDTSGAFFKSYHHRYKIITGEKSAGQDELTFKTQPSAWMEVPESFYKKHASMLGMTILSKGEDGKVSRVGQPPGYEYVGNPRYGEWRRDDGGRSFWVFYGQYALFRDLLGLGTRPLYRGDWNEYRGYRSSGRPYFGPDQRYGTTGSFTKTSNPTFFERQQSRESARSQRFSNKAKSRGRSSRGFGRGK